MDTVSSLLFVPFYKREKIEYNRNFVSIGLNLIIGIIRATILVPTMAHLFTSVPFIIKRMFQFGETWSLHWFVTLRIILEIPVCIIIIADCISVSTVFIGYGNYIDRMKTSLIAY